MKRNTILLFSILLLACLLIACGGKDNKTVNEIVGKWEFLDIEYDVDVPNTDNIDKIEEILEGYEVMIRENAPMWSMEFTRDGRSVGNSREGDSYTISGDTLSIFTGMQKEMMKFRIGGDTLITEVDVTRDIKAAVSMRDVDENIEKCICRIFYVREK